MRITLSLAAINVKKTALSVGNCGWDESSLRRVVAGRFGAELEAVDTAEEALAALRRKRYDLVLVNRVFDLDGDSGLALIERIKRDAELAATPVMLISNYPEYQSQAEKLGAAPGVGKSNLSSPEGLERLGAFLRSDDAGSAS